MAPPLMHTVSNDPTRLGGTAVRMTTDDAKALAVMIHSLRSRMAHPWAFQDVLGVCYRAKTDYGDRRDVGAIEIAMIAAARNEFVETPTDMLTGDYWAGLDDFLRTGTTGRQYASSHDRAVLEDAAAGHARRDLSGSRRGYAAATERLAELQAAR